MDIFVKAMGRGSDTRIYAPRSESSNMYSSANEDESKYNPASPEYNDAMREKKKLKEEENKARKSKIKHLKISSKQPLSGEESPVGIDDGNKRDDEREMGLQGGPAGSRGTLLDLATGAKSGTGSAMSPGLPIAMSEPMENAWSSLLKRFDPDDAGFRGYDDYMSEYGGGPSEEPEECPACDGEGEVDNDEIEEYETCKVCDGTGENPNWEFHLDRDYHKFNERCGGCGIEAQTYNEPTSYDRELYGSDDEHHNFRTTHAFNLRNGKFSDDAGDDSHGIKNMEFHRYDNYDNSNVTGDYESDNTPKFCRHCEGVLEHVDDKYGFSNGVDNATTINGQQMWMGEYPNQFANPELTTQAQKEVFAGFDASPHLDENGQPKENQVQTGIPMEDAWSELLKRDTPNTIQARRRRESRRQFRPSTGQFKTPPGGMSGGVGATKRRHAARMRGISSGKKTGLMKPHLSVEMSHRGIATKQPMSKDPQKYTAYRGQSEARKIQGNVRTPFSPRGRYGQRSFTAGPTGAGRLSGLLAGQRGQMRQPSLRQLGVKRPRIRRPRAPPMPPMPQMPMGQSSVPNMPAPPSSIMMSEDAQVYSDLLKAKNIVQRFELLNLMRRLIAAKEKEAKIKKYVQGGGSAFEDGHVPDHPAGVHQHEDEEEKNDGPTQNLETNSSRLGLDPAGYLSSKRGHMG